MRRGDNNDNDDDRDNDDDNNDDDDDENTRYFKSPRTKASLLRSKRARECDVRRDLR